MRKLSLLTTLLVSAPLALGQFTSSVEGTVLDSSQAVVPGTRVVMVNKLTEGTRQASSSEAGFFRISGLPSGTYEVEVSRDGFKTWLQTSLVLNGSQARTIYPMLQVG